MSWITRIFGNNTNEKSPNGNNNPEITGINPDDQVNVLEDLFVDNTAPQTETEQKTTEKVDSNILTFLEQDYTGIGYGDGYNYHSYERLIQGIKAIKADFRLELDQLIDKKTCERLGLENDRIEVGKMSEELDRKLELQINSFNLSIDKLEKEKELTAEDEGWVMKAVHKYHDGFLKGMEAYFEEKRIAGITGMFN